jgi:serine/threonine protein kinase
MNLHRDCEAHTYTQLYPIPYRELGTLRYTAPVSVLGDVGNRTSKLGRYELITRIGEGGMAEVQLALQRGPAGFEKLVVVKLVHENLAAQKDFVDMLLDEARVAALLKHPNVVDIYDLGQAEGRFFIAMEYLEGEPLLAVLRAGREGKRLDILSTARLIADTAEGLDAAHELRSMGGDPLELVHHDVSLGNIVVLYNGQVKLVDFGVAKATQSVSQSRRVQGKFSYMAPEKLRGGAGDRRSDIWSLGCVLWEALTLKRLFKGGNDNDTMRQVLESEIPTPSRINSEVLAALDPIVMRTLQRDPELRYPTAKEVAGDLEEVLRTEGYGGKNDRIAKYMQATFKAHIDARKRLLQEVSSKGRASADVLEAAFDDQMLASGSPIHSGDFSARYKATTLEVRPGTGKPARFDSTPSPRINDPFMQAPGAPQPITYPRAIPSDLPPIVEREDENDENAATVLMGNPDELGSLFDPAVPARLPDERTDNVRGPASRRRTYIAIAAGGIALLVTVLLIARRGGDASTDNAGPSAGHEGQPATAPPDAAELAADAQIAATPPDDPAGAAARSGGSGDAVDPAIELPPDRVGKPRPPPKWPEKPDPTALYRSGINAYVVGDMKTALAQFKRAIAANPNLAIAWRGVGMVHERLGDPRAANTAFQRYLQLAPNASDAATIRGKIGGGR